MSWFLDKERIIALNIVVDLKSLGYFKDTSLELSPLIVLTGVNGSGKTTILNAIENQFDNVRHYKWTGLSVFEKHLEGVKGDILLFEQPEAGLHPKFQLVIADILLTYALTGRTVVVETHSDHIINRLVRRFIESQEVRNVMKIFFLEQESGLEERKSKITDIYIDEYKGTLRYPEFFTQFDSETSAIVDTGMKKLLDKSNGKSNAEEIKITIDKGVINAPLDFFSQFASETMEICKASINNRKM